MRPLHSWDALRYLVTQAAVMLTLWPLGNSTRVHPEVEATSFALPVEEGGADLRVSGLTSISMISLFFSTRICMVCLVLSTVWGGAEAASPCPLIWHQPPPNANHDFVIPLRPVLRGVSSSLKHPA